MLLVGFLVIIGRALFMSQFTKLLASIMKIYQVNVSGFFFGL